MKILDRHIDLALTPWLQRHLSPKSGEVRYSHRQLGAFAQEIDRLKQDELVVSYPDEDHFIILSWVIAPSPQTASPIHRSRLGLSLLYQTPLGRYTTTYYHHHTEAELLRYGDAPLTPEIEDLFTLFHNTVKEQGIFGLLFQLLIERKTS